jgi:hypothetical protein
MPPGNAILPGSINRSRRCRNNPSPRTRDVRRSAARADSLMYEPAYSASFSSFPAEGDIAVRRAFECQMRRQTRRLARSPNVEKPEHENTGNHQHPQLEVNIRDREVRDKPVPHLVPPALNRAMPVAAPPKVPRLDVYAIPADQQVFGFGGVVFDSGNGTAPFTWRLFRAHARRAKHTY